MPDIDSTIDEKAVNKRHRTVRSTGKEFPLFSSLSLLASSPFPCPLLSSLPPICCMPFLVLCAVQKRECVEQRHAFFSLSLFLIAVTGEEKHGCQVEEEEKEGKGRKEKELLARHAESGIHSFVPFTTVRFLALKGTCKKPLGPLSPGFISLVGW